MTFMTRLRCKGSCLAEQSLSAGLFSSMVLSVGLPVKSVAGSLDLSLATGLRCLPQEFKP
ncbi:hypothetical protein HMPREF0322_02268 [Desulfitobacterium hafniense DP7]|uniref:Uncharacterized protein n=1 Tax=Desulfitobacterium hafniense DP7 TaxID=537010 RepID=G9XMT0_DESHA|nr:hypothetical protein HMPREF0322_02268 [Desulfitobacterium hafniense DP7]